MRLISLDINESSSVAVRQHRVGLCAKEMCEELGGGYEGQRDYRESAEFSGFSRWIGKSAKPLSK
jgi:hypothetical protein